MRLLLTKKKTKKKLCLSAQNLPSIQDGIHFIEPAGVSAPLTLGLLSPPLLSRLSPSIFPPLFWQRHLISRRDRSCLCGGPRCIFIEKTELGKKKEKEKGGWGGGGEQSAFRVENFRLFIDFYLCR